MENISYELNTQSSILMISAQDRVGRQNRRWIIIGQTEF